MENISTQNIPTPPPQPYVEPAKPSSPKGLLILLVVLEVITLVVAGYFGYQYNQLKKQVAIPQTTTAPNASSTVPTQTTISPTIQPTADWNTYANTKYGYSLKHPNDYLVGYADVRIGTFNKSNGNEDQIDFLPSEVDEFNNFLQIQVTGLKPYNKSLTEVVDGIYQQQKSHFQTTDISSVAKSKFVGYDDYEYTFSGQAFYTLSWNGTVKSGKYKAIFFQKDGNIYSFYLKDTDIFNQILSTLKFTN